MQYIPKKTKFKKQRKGKLLNIISPPRLLNNLYFGSIALKAIDSGRLTSKHIISCKQTINKILSKKIEIKGTSEKKVKRFGQLKLDFFPHTPVSKKPLEIRMGKGKGNIDHWAANIYSGAILFEIETSNKMLAVKALKVVQNKLPINTQIIFEKD